MAKTMIGLTCGTDIGTVKIALVRGEIFSVLWPAPRKSGFFR
jgi:hypothetical protein